MKTYEEITEEIDINIGIINDMIAQQKAGVVLNEIDMIVRADASSRINALLWVLGEID